MRYSNVAAVSEVRWWVRPEFANARTRAAAELVAFDILDPVLRSRGAALKEAGVLYKDNAFRQRMTDLFNGGPDGSYRPRSLADALERIVVLEDAVASLSARLAGLEARRN